MVVLLAALILARPIGNVIAAVIFVLIGLAMLALTHPGVTVVCLVLGIAVWMVWPAHRRPRPALPSHMSVARGTPSGLRVGRDDRLARR